MYLKIKSSFLFIFVFNSCVFCRYIEDQIANYSNPVEEIQHAICKIATDDIQASANASITRQLKGICTSREMNNHFDRLEMRILNELNLIKQALGLENNSVGEIQPKTSENKAQAYNEDYDYLNSIESVEIDRQINPQLNRYRSLQTSEDVNVTENLKIKSPASNLDLNSYKRDLEAAKNNITIQNTELGKSFLYFWKIYDIEEILTFSDTHIDSPTFYLSGNQLQIKFHPHHLGTHYVALELSSNKNFLPKHRFTVLNQNDVKGDVSSQILGTNAAIFRISAQRLENGEFTADGSLIIKVIVALRN